ncbi:LPXTG cell wall anchor domain-containing protein [Microbacterium sp. SL75]|uniref:LPXTG cell wall anchor domain-containing protein n=1 Tax=Microbacterium sp. SL75 TaxID=2995140 RepID=UPI00226E5D91|nr:LPXTG cell wall anchor domain-containing protein [Microbacterium sp. SL75]WAC69359.1 LPXTG cell wall anchor domain-containing protein [Microbacterium sp. SL75]
MLNSQPLTITGIPAADARGAVTFRVTVPADFATGAHTLVITRADGSTLARLGVQVVPAGSLARTGAEMSWALGLGAFGLIAAGAGLVALRRRSRSV